MKDYVFACFFQETQLATYTHINAMNVAGLEFQKRLVKIVVVALITAFLESNGAFPRKLQQVWCYLYEQFFVTSSFCNQFIILEPASRYFSLNMLHSKSLSLFCRYLLFWIFGKIYKKTYKKSLVNAQIHKSSTPLHIFWWEIFPNFHNSYFSKLSSWPLLYLTFFVYRTTM